MIKLFYILKPLIPRAFQIYIRRKLANLKREKFKNVWPILEIAGKKPGDWPGWPEGKRFAFILTHDVEFKKGHDKCLELALREKELGFVSSYNFVPERYEVSSELRSQLVKLGFEVGVHGLRHDGKLFRSREIFSERSKKINSYLNKWKAVGFRAPAMHHNLEWIGNLDITYDLSTFDTDPFEPQSDGVETIFPYIVNKSNKADSYVEMPYTLVQDFTLLILMKEKDIKIWQKKIDWIAEKGGMALINVHPDYISFNGNLGKEEYPIELYINLLDYAHNQYRDMFWNVLPKDLAQYIKHGKNKITLNYNANL